MMTVWSARRPTDILFQLSCYCKRE
uniref:Uncharacterized protein n=1 Tax=Anguilla anguilla TaxID=7936 RepID=A0A0E9T1U3_ANGAN